MFKDSHKDITTVILLSILLTFKHVYTHFPLVEQVEQFLAEMYLIKAKNEKH